MYIELCRFLILVATKLFSISRNAGCGRYYYKQFSSVCAHKFAAVQNNLPGTAFSHFALLAKFTKISAS